MDAREAVQTARDFIKTLYSNEPIAEVSVEEINFDEEGSPYWSVTIGFRRLWDRPAVQVESMMGVVGEKDRVFKEILMRDRDGSVFSMKTRVFELSTL